MILELISCQLIVVTAPNWESHQGMLYRFERTDPASQEWKLQGSPFPVVLGKNGMAWGIGLHSSKGSDGFDKREGDGKAPAGIFSLGPAFGFAPSLEGVKIDYMILDRTTEAVDDPQSRYYNQIVKRNQILDLDWTSSEKMSEIPFYEMGLVVHHNWPHPILGAGSAIFMHLWKDENSGTAGCTAMSPSNMHDLLTWLDPQKKTLLIQLPTSIYRQWGIKDILEKNKSMRVKIF